MEGLSRQSDFVVIASQGRNAEDVRIPLVEGGPDVVFSIVELHVDEVLKSESKFPAETISVWIPREFVPSGLPDQYVLFLRRPPDDFSATALEHLAKHPNGMIMVSGSTSIMDIVGDDVSARGGTFYGLRAADGLPIASPDGTKLEAPFVLKFSLADVRTMAMSITGPPPTIPPEPEPSMADQLWLERLDRLCEQSLPTALELRDLLTEAYDAGQVDGVRALDLFDRSALDRTALEKDLAGLSADLVRRWETAVKASDAARPVLARAVEQSGDEFRATLIEFQSVIRSFQMAWTDTAVPNCRQIG